MLKGVGTVMLLSVMYLPVLAQGNADKGLDVSLGMFFVSDSGEADFMGTGIGINVEKKIASLSTSDLYASVGWIKFSETG